MSIIILSASPIKINPLPYVVLSGTPLLNHQILVYDGNGGNYYANTISAEYWSFGDGSTSASSATTTHYVHTYSAAGLYDVIVSAVDVSGNRGTDTYTVAILGTDLDTEKSDYITLCGPESPFRYKKSKHINLTNFLPDFLKETTTFDFIQVYQDQLNNLFDDLDGYTLSSSDLNVNDNTDLDFIADANTSAVDVQYIFSGTNVVTVSGNSYNPQRVDIIYPENSLDISPKISILEKIARLGDLHNPDLCPKNLLGYYANELGYNINMTLDDIGIGETFGNMGLDGTSCSALNAEKYLRFSLSQLSEFYRSKTTDASVRLLLYSYGLNANLITRYTSNYLPIVSGGEWINNYNRNLTGIPNYFYPTTHFSIVVDLDTSENISTNSAKYNKVIKCIESIQPVASVFDRLSGYITRQLDMWVGANSRINRYDAIQSPQSINNWYDPSNRSWYSAPTPVARLQIW